MKRLSFFYIVLAGGLWGTMGIFVRILTEKGLSSMEIVSLRAFITALLMILGLFIYKKSLLKIRWKDCWCFLGTGVCSIVFFNYCYFKTILYTSLSVAAILLYTAPSIVMILSLILFHEKINKQKVCSLMLAFLGCICVTGIIGDTNMITGSGILTGLGAGLGYALYSIFSRYALERGYHPMTITTYTFVFASLSVLPFINLNRIGTVLFNGNWTFIFCVIFGLVTTVLPYLSYTIGLNYIENGKASIIASIEPVVATLIGVFVYHEHLDFIGFFGILLILMSLIILNGKIGKQPIEIEND